MPSGPSYDVPVAQNFSHLDCRPWPHLIYTPFQSFKTFDSIFLLNLATPFLAISSASGSNAVHLPMKTRHLAPACSRG